jgi:hypothetical protein
LWRLYLSNKITIINKLSQPLTFGKKFTYEPNIMEARAYNLPIDNKKKKSRPTIPFTKPSIKDSIPLRMYDVE